jgi:hypothetical protein
MKKAVPPYRRGIWKIHPRYRLAYERLSKDELAAIFRLSAVDAAKKQIPPIAHSDLLKIWEHMKALPRARAVESKGIETYLRQGSKVLGAGIATLICMLAVERKGNYPPMDRKFAAGMRARNKISASEFDDLTGKSYSAFAETYVRKVIPAWRQSRKTRSPKEADWYWANSAKKGAAA